MTPEGWRRNEANRWLAVAGKDLHAARLLIKEEPWAAVFHCQQAAEKSAKAFLTLHEVAFRRTHDLNELGKQCIALDAGLTPLLEEAAGLTDYAVVFRYLDAPHEPDEAEAESALAIAQRLYDRVRGLVGLDESMETEGDHEWGPNCGTPKAGWVHNRSVIDSNGKAKHRCSLGREARTGSAACG